MSRVSVLVPVLSALVLHLLSVPSAMALIAGDRGAGLGLELEDTMGADLLAPDPYFEIAPPAAPLTAEEADAEFARDGSSAVVARFAAQPRTTATGGLAAYLLALDSALRGEHDPAALDRLGGRSEPGRFYAPLIRALVADGDGAPAVAERAVREALDARPQHPFARNLLGRLLVGNGQTAAAQAEFERAIEQAPRFAAALSNLGAVRFLRRDAAGALQMFDRALAVAPGFCPAVLGRSAVLLERGDLNGAAEGLEPCAAVPGFELRTLVRQVNLASLGRDLQRAAEIARQITAIDTVTGSFWSARVAMQRGEPAAAALSLQAVPVTQPDRLYLEAFIAAARGDLTRAQQLTGRVLSAASSQPGPAFVQAVFAFADGKPSAPGGADLARQLPQAWAFLQAGRASAAGDRETALAQWRASSGLVAGFDLTGASDGAMRAATGPDGQQDAALALLFYLRDYLPSAKMFVDRAIDANADSLTAQLLRAIIAARLGDVGESRLAVQKLLEIEPDLFVALYEAAERAAAESRMDDARALYRRAAAQKADPGVLLRLALLADAADDLAEAEDAMRRYIELLPDNYIGYNQLAWFYTKRGQRLDSALELAQTANTLRPGNVSILDTLGWIRFQQNRLDDAERYLAAANEAAFGRHPDVLYHLAALAERRGDATRARSLLDKALQNGGTFENREEAQALRRRLGGS